MITSMEDTIKKLLRFSRPGGETEKRLLKIQDQIDRNVMVGPKSRRYLEKLLQQLDNVECDFMSAKGLCSRKAMTPCQFRSSFAECEIYEPYRVTVSRNPLQL